MQTIADLVSRIRASYGWVCELDACTAHAREKHELNRAAIDPESTMFFGTGDPNSGEAITTHAIKMHEYEKNIEFDGKNSSIAKNASLIMIYETWDHVTRPSIASHLNIPLNNLRRPVWGDLRHLRNACAHHDQKLRKPLEVFDLFEVGDLVVLRKEIYETIIWALLRDCEEMTSEYFDEKVNYPFSMWLK